MTTSTRTDSNPNTPTRTVPIAVVGLGCWYPGARNPKELWENILARRRQFRRMPDCRLPLSEYQADDRRTPDKTYGVRAAVIDGYQFDWAGRRIPRSAYEATDMAHWLALDVALQMLDDAGYTAASLPQKTTQVIVGNTLTGEFSRSNMLRLRWPFVNKVLAATAQRMGMQPEAIVELARSMEQSFKSVFAPVDEDSLAGGLSNTIAGRICNFLNLNGGGYTVDGACSSSLIAVYSAASSLAAGTADFAIAGGVDISLDPFELVGFAKTGALTSSEMSVYDKRGNGFIPGEGCGFVGLKRLADAVRDGNKVYAVLDGWGMSSDGKGGITAPSVAGQSLALGRAYALAGVDPGAIDFIEGHGTGTAVGDRTELLGIAKAIADGGGATKRRTGVTSFKSIVGHTKAAAGVGAFIKAVLAVNQRVVPPTAGCAIPHEVFSGDAASTYPIVRGRVVPAEGELRAGVSAMGFGGINVHVTLRSGNAPAPDLRPAIGERSAMASRQDSEVLCFSARTHADLRRVVGEAARDVAGASLAELADLAASLNSAIEPGLPFRAAVVASSPEQMGERLRALELRLESPPSLEAVVIDSEAGAAFGHVTKPRSLAFVFPGQGAQKANVGRVLVDRFEWARALVDAADGWAAQLGTKNLAASLFVDSDRLVDKTEVDEAAARLKPTQVAQPAIVLSSLLWLHYLKRVGISPTAVMGHSLGELTAFFAAGAFDEKALVQLATVRGQLMAAGSEVPTAGMTSLACDRAAAADLVATVGTTGTLVVANINGPQQTVVSGDLSALESLKALAERRGIKAVPLPVSNAFHSPLVARAAEKLRELAPIPQTPLRLRCSVISSRDGRPVPADRNMREHFAKQIVEPVDFVHALETLSRTCDAIVEVGPGNALSNLIAKPGGGTAMVALPVERSPEAFGDLNWVLASAHTSGVTLRWDEVYARRILRPFTPARNQSFLVNPCERTLDAGDGEREVFTEFLTERLRDTSSAIDGDAEHARTLEAGTRNPQDGRADGAGMDRSASPALVRSNPTAATAYPLLVALAAKLTGFSASEMTPQLRLLDDLNLDSIKVTALIGNASASLGVLGVLDPSALAGATLGDIAARLDALVPARPTAARATISPEDLLLDLAAKQTGFDRSTLAPTFSLLDDLNLDSIKISALLSQAAATLGIESGFDPSQLAKATIGEVAAKMRALLAGSAGTSPAQAPAPRLRQRSWVRSFEMRATARSVDLSLAATDYRNRVVAIQCDDAHGALAAALRSRLTAAGAIVVTVGGGEPTHEAGDIHHYIVLLPRGGSSAGSRREPLHRTIARLRPAALVSAGKSACASVIFVQFGGIQVEPGDSSATIASGCASSFAATLHLERPNVGVLVLDFHEGHSDDFVADRVMDERISTGAYVLGHYGESGRRYAQAPVAVEAHLQPPRDLRWDASDVVLVTGGAKGITAECALAFAKVTRARMVLIGSSPNSKDEPSPEVNQTLARYAEAGLFARYYACDVVDPDAVHRLVRQIAQEVGPVTGVIHGAGVNKPRRIEQVDETEALRKIGPKLVGLLNLCDALENAPPKLMVGMSSIIGITGMHGNAWYAFSNEALHAQLLAFRRAHPATDVVALAYSVWDEVGMGARLGATGHLEQLGIAAIPLDGGVQHFLHSVLGKSSASHVVIASRLGGLDTWHPTTSALPEANRFLQNVTSLEPGVEIVARTRLTLDDDLYLRDHYFRGVYLFPTVFGLEAMAQAVAHLLGKSELTSLQITDIQLTRPIVVGSGKGTEIEVRAEVLERSSFNDPISVRVGIRTEQTSFIHDHFAGTFVLEAPRVVETTRLVAPPAAVDIDPKTELYGGLLFQGSLFQRLERVWSMDSAGSLIGIRRNAPAEYFSPQYAGRLILGDPSFRDVLLQSAQLSVKGILLPIGIDALHIHSLQRGEPGVVLARNDLTERNETGPVCAVTATGEDGVLETLVGYRLKQMELDPASADPEDWVNPTARDARIFRETLQALGQATTPFWSLTFVPRLAGMDRSNRRLLEAPLVLDVAARALYAAGDTNPGALELQWSDDGKPSIHGTSEEQLGVSLSHDGRYCLCVAGAGAQGCDLESIATRTHAEWVGILGAPQEQMLRQLVDSGDSVDEAGTRLWCAFESVRKALGAGPIEIVAHRRDAHATVFSLRIEGRNAEVVTFSVRLTRPPVRMVALVLRADARVAPAARPASASGLRRAVTPLDGEAYSYATTGPNVQPELRYRFRVTFKDTTTLRRGLHFDVFADWMGRIRELATVTIADRLVADFASGEWGMVTNHSNIRVVGDASSLDLIEGRMHVVRAYGQFGSSVDLHFEWVAIGRDGSEHPVATSEMTTTWVKILSHGAVELRPFPAYMQELIDSYLPAPAAVVVGTVEPDLRLELPGARQGIDFGPAIYVAPKAPRVEPELVSLTFDTTSAESNLVGNVYYANYYRWAGRVIDRFFHSIALKQGSKSPRGQVVCRAATVRHLREAMPFDRIEVVMALRGLYQGGLELHFAFYKLTDDGERSKLAVGELEGVWMDGETGKVGALPEHLVSALAERSRAAA